VCQSCVTRGHRPALKVVARTYARVCDVESATRGRATPEITLAQENEAGSGASRSPTDEAEPDSQLVVARKRKRRALAAQLQRGERVGEERAI
jgi:hypothetical protein